MVHLRNLSYTTLPIIGTKIIDPIVEAKTESSYLAKPSNACIEGNLQLSATSSGSEHHFPSRVMGNCWDERRLAPTEISDCNLPVTM